MMQQMARGNRASPRDRAKPTEQHIAQLTPLRRSERGEVEVWNEGDSAGEERRLKQLPSQETKASEESAAPVTGGECESVGVQVLG